MKRALVIAALIHAGLIAVVSGMDRPGHATEATPIELAVNTPTPVRLLTAPLPTPSATSPASTAPAASTDSSASTDDQPAAKPAPSHAATAGRARRRRLAEEQSRADAPVIEDTPSRSDTGVPVSSAAASSTTTSTTAAVLSDMATAPPSAPPSGSGSGSASASGAAFDRNRYAARVRDLIVSSRRYPTGARRLGHEGTAIVAVRVTRSGSLAGSPRLRRSSGSSLLDAEALRMVRASAPYPKHQSTTNPLELVVPVQFSLDEAD
jgi:protein TonB